MALLVFKTSVLAPEGAAGRFDSDTLPPIKDGVPKDQKGNLGGTLLKGVYPIAEHMPQVFGQYYAAVEPEVILSLIEELLIHVNQVRSWLVDTHS